MLNCPTTDNAELQLIYRNTSCSLKYIVVLLQIPYVTRVNRKTATKFHIIFKVDASFGCMRITGPSNICISAQQEGRSSL